MASESVVRTAFSPGFREAASAFLVGNFIEESTWIATLVFAYEQHGASAAGFAQALILLLATLSLPLQSRWYERFRPFAGTQAAMGLFAVSCLGTGALGLVGAPLPILWIGLTVVAAISANYRPVINSTLPTIARGGEALAAQNAVISWFESAGKVFGPLLCALVLHFGSEHTLIGKPGAASGLAYMLLLAGVLALGASVFVHAPTTREQQENPPRSIEKRVGLQSSSVETPGSQDLVNAKERREPLLRLVFRRRALRTLFLLTLGVFLAKGAMDIMYIALAKDSGLGESKAGLIAAAYGVGGLASYFFRSYVLGRAGLGARVVTLGFIGSLAWIAISPLTTKVLPVVGLVFVSGVAFAGFGMVRQTLIQRAAPPEDLLRVTSAYQVAVTIGFALGPFIVSLAGSTRNGAIATGLTLPVMIVLLSRGLRAVDSDADIPVTEISLLSRVGILRSLRPATVEGLARCCHVRMYRAGLPVVQEGDVGQELFVVVDGDVEVIRGERTLASLGRGDIFGEVAIMNDQPRNATVRAVTNVQLLAIPREDFVNLVGLHQQVSVHLEELVEQRQ